MDYLPFLYGFAGYLVFYLGMAVYHASIAGLGLRYGIALKDIQLGYGPKIYKRKYAGWELRIGVLPFGAYTTFQGDDWEEQGNPEPRGMQSLSGLQKLVVMVSGPLSVLLVGLLTLGLPIWAGADRLVVTLPDDSMVSPCAVPGLAVSAEPTTWDSQGQLVRGTALEFFIRLVTFQSLEHWGGLMGFFVTVGGVGTISAGGWLSCLGVIFVWMGLWNLVPIPPQIGGLALYALYQAVTSSPLSEARRVSLTWIGLIVMLVFAIRAVWADLCWLSGVIFG